VSSQCYSSNLFLEIESKLEFADFNKDGDNVRHFRQTNGPTFTSSRNYSRNSSSPRPLSRPPHTPRTTFRLSSFGHSTKHRSISVLPRPARKFRNRKENENCIRSWNKEEFGKVFRADTAPCCHEETDFDKSGCGEKSCCRWAETG
jgi:hypothetical protein